MEKLTNLKISLRRDTLENWELHNPVLKDGEMAVVKINDTGDIELKVGNGTSAFKDLPFLHQNQLSTESLSADEITAGGLTAKTVDAKDVTASSIAQGLHAHATPYGLAAGAFLSANANFSQAMGIDVETLSSDSYSFAWSGDDSRGLGDYYKSHGKGTFSVNPISGLSGFYIGEKNLQEVIKDEVNIIVEDYYRKNETSSSVELSGEFNKKIEMSYGDETLNLWNYL